MLFLYLPISAVYVSTTEKKRDFGNTSKATEFHKIKSTSKIHGARTMESVYMNAHMANDAVYITQCANWVKQTYVLFNVFITVDIRY